MSTDSSAFLSNGVRKGFLNIVDTSGLDVQFCVVGWRTSTNARRGRVQAVAARSRDQLVSELILKAATMIWRCYVKIQDFNHLLHRAACFRL